GQSEGALSAHQEAIVIFTPLFERYPGPLSGKMGAMAKEYIERCERANQPINEETLAPVVALFEAMKNQN
ncbi:MAG: hypothetical protein BM560_14515, partial [Roseobacter sp. MedPE-SWde]